MSVAATRGAPVYAGTPDRDPDLLDELANTGGVLLGWLAACLLPNLPERLAALFAFRR